MKCRMILVTVSAFILTVGGFVFLGAGVALAASNEKVVIKYSHVQSPTSPTGLAAEFLKKYLEEKSSGRITMEIFPSGQLYNDNTEIDALISGNVDLLSTYMGKMTGLDPSLQFCLAPFIFDSPEQMLAFYGDEGNKAVVYKKIAAQDIEVLSVFFAGSQYFMSNAKKITSPEDLKGMKVREGGGRMIAALYSAVGASVTTVAYSDLYTAMQTKLVDAVVTSIDGAVAIKLQETIKFVSLFDHILAPYVMMVNRTKFNSYDEETQTIITDGLKAAQAFQLEKIYELTKKGMDEMKTSCEFYQPTQEEKDAFKKVWNPIVAEFVDSDVSSAIERFKASWKN